MNNIYPLSSLCVSPTFDVDNTVFVSTRGDGIYRSQNGGDFWEKVKAGLDSLDIRLLAISPQFVLNHTVLAADSEGRVYRSLDGGKAWKMILAGKSEITTIAFPPTGYEDHVLAGDAEGSIYLLQDSGGDWKEIAQHTACGAINSIAISPYYNSDKTIWIGTEKCGVLKSDDGGMSFVELNTGLSEKRITSLLASSRTSQGITLYASTWHEALFRSEDGGRSWQKCGSGLTTDPQADDPGFLLPYFKGIAVNGSTLFLGGFDGLFKSSDGGKTWGQLETWPLNYISSLALSPVIHQSHYSAFLAYGGGAYLIVDANDGDWINKAGCLTLAGRKGVRTDSGISDVVFTPSYGTDHTIFAAGEHELMKSIDEGKNWTRVQVKPPMLLRLRKRIYRYMRKVGMSHATITKIVGFFPLIPGWSTYIAVSPNYEKDSTVFFGTQGVGLCKSSDKGESCSIVFDSADKITNSLPISPDFVDDRTLFIGIKGDGVYKTEDGGRTFRKADFGMDVVGAIRLAISPDYNTDKMMMAGTGAGLFMTHDGGERWDRIGEKALLLNGVILDVAISPNFSTDKTVLVAVKGLGVFKSTDGGNTFSAIGTELIENNYQLKQIRFSSLYANDSVLYGISAEHIFRSRDGGDSWNVIPRPVRYEDVQDIITYEGNWETVKGAEYSDSTQTRSKIPGNKARLRFFGTGVRLVSEKSPEHGFARVYIDGELIDELSFKNNVRQSEISVFSSSKLSKGVHEITVEVCGSKETLGWTSIDAFEILP
ncbi:MAG: hypothetical protein U9R60_08460 [Bacteroidota bacterium]|nr:hypothetical protein [Bacteroidota bacterium]